MGFQDQKSTDARPGATRAGRFLKLLVLYIGKNIREMY
jgi:hypothetical protein